MNFQPQVTPLFSTHFLPRRQLQNSWSSQKVDWEYQTWRLQKGGRHATLGLGTLKPPHFDWNANFFTLTYNVTFEKGRFSVKLRERVVGWNLHKTLFLNLGNWWNFAKFGNKLWKHEIGKTHVVWCSNGHKPKCCKLMLVLDIPIHNWV